MENLRRLIFWTKKKDKNPIYMVNLGKKKNVLIKKHILFYGVFYKLCRIDFGFYVSVFLLAFEGA